MASGDTLDTGIWCPDCGFFELQDSIEDGMCSSCGCPEDVHVPAVVKEVEA